MAESHKHPGGRPTKYKDTFPAEIISLMSEGLSLTAAAASIGICRETAYAWEREIPEFSDAVKLGRAKRTLKLERDLMAAETSPIVTSRIFALKNACAAEWREKIETDHTSSDGTMTPKSTVNLNGLSDAALAELVAARDAAKGN